MRKFMYTGLIAVTSLVASCRMLPDKQVNLVSEEAANSPNYWCTWYAQSYWIKRGQNMKELKGITNAAAREELNEHTLFNAKDGWATTYLPGARKDYIFLIDHGWQTKDPNKRIAGGEAFFNMVAEETDFPRYKGMEPKEVLKKFNEDIKALGWNSLGLWVRGNVTEEEARTFVKWSKYAGIRYWKIDGGDTRNFYCTKAKDELYPELILEYVTGAGGNINPKWNQERTSYPSVYEIGGSLQKPMLKCLENSDVFRTYDASPLLMSTTTLRRTHDILKQSQQQPKYRAILNVQDDCNVAVGLGVLVASKRHPNMGERLLQGKDLHHQLSGPRCMQKRINEAERFGRWARIAPAFSAGEGVYLSSDEELIDHCEFTKWDTWAKSTYGKMVSQSAPAVMARNMPLPIVECDGPKPFVCASTYPNGPTGIATEGRVTPENRWFEPRARVTVKIKDAGQPIGVVGHYKELVLKFADSVENINALWAQDLLADKAENILSKVIVKGNTITVSGELIDRIGTAAGDKGDNSVPGMVIRLEGSDLPLAGADYIPVTKPVTTVKTVPVEKNKGVDGYSGTAKVTKKTGGYVVSANGLAQVALRKLDKNITSGKVSVSWTMKAISSGTKNGFIVLSSDEDANSAVVAGSWMGSNQISLFENDSTWGNDLNKACKIDGEVNCRLEVDLDLRTAVLNVNGEKLKIAFSESVTSINYIGFGVHNAKTFFSNPKVK